MRSSFRSWLLLFLLAAAPLLGSTASAQAQGERVPSLRITRVDTSDFPDVQVFLQGENLGGELAELPMALLEDGQDIEDVARDTQDVGTQTALVLDASGSVLDPGRTGDARYIEVGNLTRRLIELEVLSTQYDWLAAYAPGPDGAITAIKEWTRDHQAVANSLYIYQPPTSIELETPLYDLLYFALDNLRSEEAPENTSKAVVLFSDGLSGSSSLELNDAVARAAELNVQFHTVLLGEPIEEGQRNMQRIATLTGGRAYELTSLDALDSLWQSVVQERGQLVVNYRSRQASPEEIVVSATLPDGTTVRAATAFPTVDVQPVQVSMVRPTGELQLTKEAPVYDTALEELEPKAIDVEVDFSWLDGRPREIRRVEYSIGTDTIVRDEPPFDEVTFPITKLDSGRYTLRVLATDELGLEGRSAPFTFEVNVTRPPAPTPVPPTYDVLGVATIPQSQVSTLASLLAVGLGVLAVIVAFRRPVVRERVAEAITGAVKAVTEPFMFNRGDAMKGSEVKARLMVEDRGRAASLPPFVELRGGTTRIGRVPEYANLVLDDPRVSRYHCRITEDPEGNLCLFDEGGSSGTYVNYEPVDMEGYVLQSGDLINVGPIQLRFQYGSDVDDPRTEPFAGLGEQDKTEPYTSYLSDK